MGHWEKDRYGEGVEEGEGQGGPQQGQGEDHKGAHEVHLERGADSIYKSQYRSVWMLRHHLEIFSNVSSAVVS